MILIWFYAAVFILGLIIGSFLNAVIYRLENGETLWGRSYCPHCKHVLEPHNLIPVLSFFWTGGKCQYCKKNISWWYPSLEILTALIFVLIFHEFLMYQSINILFLFYIFSSLIVIFVYDLKHYIIPDIILFPAIVAAFLHQLFLHPNLLIINPVLSGLAASAFFLFLFIVSGGKWIGFGDVKLAILLGLILGFPNILIGLFLAFVIGAASGLVFMAYQRKGLKSEIPFGPFLITGTFIALTRGDNIVNWYLSYFFNT